MKYRIPELLVSTAMSGIAFLPTAASAAATGPSDTALEEIVVTAEKKTETASKTPVALSVFNGDTLKEAGVVSIAD